LIRKNYLLLSNFQKKIEKSSIFCSKRVDYYRVILYNVYKVKQNEVNKMKFEQLTKALTNEYLMVVNGTQEEVLGSGNIENILNGSNFAKATILQMEKLSDEEIIEWDLEDPTAAVYVVTLDI